MRPSRNALLIVAVAVVAVAVVLVAGGSAESDRTVPSKRPSAAKRAELHRLVAGAHAEWRYQSTLMRGAPVAVLKRPVALRAAPRAHAKRLARVGMRTEWRSPRVLAVTGQRGLWLRVMAAQLPNGRRGWVPIAAVRLVANPWSMRADLSSRTVSVFRRGRLVRRFSVAIGRPATPTPTGRFAVTDKINMKRHGVYGCCALALTGHQTRISPGWSGGDRLAIHATQLGWTIGTPASFGCLRATDRDARFLVRHVWLGTVVRIRR